ncbi:MAG: hypothetical protein HRT87_01305 [Legionellales bacterium]|nr:hypothetical protein [Legionellales bacterium]
MKIANYDSRFKMILDLIIQPKKVNSSLMFWRRKHEVNLEDRFEDKVRMLRMDSEINGIVMDDKKTDIIVIPVMGAEKNIFNCEPYGEMTLERRKLNPIHVSFHNDNLSTEDIKHYAARNLADLLIDKGFLKSRFQGDEIVFSVSTY